MGFIVSTFEYVTIGFESVCDFYSFDSFFKKRQQEKNLRRPRGDGDNESVEDVDDDEFEKILGESTGSTFSSCLLTLAPRVWTAAANIQQHVK